MIYQKSETAWDIGISLSEIKTQHEPSNLLLQSGRGVGPAYSTWGLSETNSPIQIHKG